MSNKRKCVAAILLGLTAAACSDDKQSSAADIAGPRFGHNVAAAAVGPVYTQVEELGNPGVSEVTIMKSRHVLYDSSMPYNTATFKPETEAFIVNVGGRPASYATAVANILYPDVLVVDTSKPTNTAGYLSWTPPPLGVNGWGGRKLTDDVVDVSLSAIFSSLLTPVGHSCAPFQLPLCTDNVNTNNKAFLAVFPYLAAP
ncbi:MAG: DUF4331 family protein [Gemmatimonadales bacterium]